MGFKREKKLTTLGKPHNWLNSPNKCHQVCIICGMRRDITYCNTTGISTTIYTTKEGKTSNEYLECK